MILPGVFSVLQNLEGLDDSTEAQGAFKSLTLLLLLLIHRWG